MSGLELIRDGLAEAREPKKNRRGLSTTPVAAGARKPGSVPPWRRRSFLWDARHRAPRAAYPGARASSPRTPLYVALLRMGFAVPQPLPSARWALTPPFHPCPETRASGAVCFLWHFPRGRPHRELPGILLYGARTFLSTRNGPSDRLSACGAGQFSPYPFRLRAGGCPLSWPLGVMPALDLARSSEPLPPAFRPE